MAEFVQRRFDLIGNTFVNETDQELAWAKSAASCCRSQSFSFRAICHDNVVLDMSSCQRPSSRRLTVLKTVGAATATSSGHQPPAVDNLGHDAKQPTRWCDCEDDSASEASFDLDETTAASHIFALTSTVATKSKLSEDTDDVSKAARRRRRRGGSKNSSDGSINVTVNSVVCNSAAMTETHGAIVGAADKHPKQRDDLVRALVVTGNSALTRAAALVASGRK
jgi:hypothetical protein|eukprot:TRINITY_DN43535_c0_g1_i1.p2 TRINITY_DN43535_c0_g1~~TRINITY_DN43535_c0_g1_i1.p2  ORF type:complete len:223 (+),score=38.08 TRINITY_DN43535_c0_g1_i1:88-756(+)